MQREVAEAASYTSIVFKNAVSFPDTGQMEDLLHYNQAGLNEMGQTGGRRVAEIQGY